MVVKYASTTIQSMTEATTIDDDEHDDDKPINKLEKKDEINDGEENAKISQDKKEESLRHKAENVYF